ERTETLARSQTALIGGRKAPPCMKSRQAARIAVLVRPDRWLRPSGRGAGVVSRVVGASIGQLLHAQGGTMAVPVRHRAPISARNRTPLGKASQNFSHAVKAGAASVMLAPVIAAASGGLALWADQNGPAAVAPA